MTSVDAFLLTRDDDGNQRLEWTSVDDADLMEGDVTVDVSHSTMNYKDALALTGSSRVVRRWPMIPGIDFAGTVAASTGATGGVGSVAVALLAKVGHEVHASTGKAKEADYLRRLGAAEVIDRDELSGPARPLGKERWVGAVDAVGSHTLANVLSCTGYGGTVAACGLAGGMDLPASVAPFILRGVTLAGIDSVMAPMDDRRAAWERLSRDLDGEALDRITETRPLADAPALAGDVLAGKVRGRVVFEVS